jgi:hypothetical protein
MEAERRAAIIYVKATLSPAEAIKAARELVKKAG